MRGIILAGGYATRLKPLTDNMPKHLLPLGDGVVLDFLTGPLLKLPVKYSLVTNSRFAKNFSQWVKENSYPIRVVDDGTTTNENRLGSIGDMVFALESESDDLFIVGADSFTDYDFSAMYELYTRVKAPVIGVFECNSEFVASQCGVVSIDANNKVTSFVEKPAKPASTLISTLFYMLPASCIPLMKKLVASGKGDKAGTLIEEILKISPVYAYVHNGYWFDIGTPQTYDDAKKFVSKQRR